MTQQGTPFVTGLNLFDPNDDDNETNFTITPSASYTNNNINSNHNDNHSHHRSLSFQRKKSGKHFRGQLSASIENSENIMPSKVKRYDSKMIKLNELRKNNNKKRLKKDYSHINLESNNFENDSLVSSPLSSIDGDNDNNNNNMDNNDDNDDEDVLGNISDSDSLSRLNPIHSQNNSITNIHNGHGLRLNPISITNNASINKGNDDDNDSVSKLSYQSQNHIHPNMLKRYFSGDNDTGIDNDETITKYFIDNDDGIELSRMSSVIGVGSVKDRVYPNPDNRIYAIALFEHKVGMTERNIKKQLKYSKINCYYIYDDIKYAIETANKTFKEIAQETLIICYESGYSTFSSMGLVTTKYTPFRLYLNTNKYDVIVLCLGEYGKLFKCDIYDYWLQMSLEYGINCIKLLSNIILNKLGKDLIDSTDKTVPKKGKHHRRKSSLIALKNFGRKYRNNNKRKINLDIDMLPLVLEKQIDGNISANKWIKDYSKQQNNDMRQNQSNIIPNNLKNKYNNNNNINDDEDGLLLNNDPLNNTSAFISWIQDNSATLYENDSVHKKEQKFLHKMNKNWNTRFDFWKSLKKVYLKNNDDNDINNDNKNIDNEINCLKIIHFIKDSLIELKDIKKKQLYNQANNIDDDDDEGDWDDQEIDNFILDECDKQFIALMDDPIIKIYLSNNKDINSNNNNSNNDNGNMDDIKKQIMILKDENGKLKRDINLLKNDGNNQVNILKSRINDIENENKQLKAELKKMNQMKNVRVGKALNDVNRYNLSDLNNNYEPYNIDTRKGFIELLNGLDSVYWNNINNNNAKNKMSELLLNKQTNNKGLLNELIVQFNIILNDYTRLSLFINSLYDQNRKKQYNNNDRIDQIKKQMMLKKTKLQNELTLMQSYAE